MRLGAPIHAEPLTPASWIAALQAQGYTAAYCPISADADEATRRAYVAAARDADIIIAEVGAWSNPLSADPDERRAAIATCQTQLALADDIGARCCVNIAGSCGQPWDGPHPDNLTPATFDRIVDTVRTILRAVNPSRTFYSLEPMPWMYPHTADSYLALLQAIDHPHFGVHIDMVNVINSPERYFDNAALIREWFAKLGPHIRSCHAKDTRLDVRLTTHLDEVRPGEGNLDYATLLTELAALDPDTPLMVEHLATDEDYRLAAAHIRNVAADIGVSFAGGHA